MTKVVNLLGVPGSTKSTIALNLTGQLKAAGRKAEYLPEYAKKMIYMGREKTLQEQVYIFAKQMHELDALVNCGFIDICIVDSPLIFSCLYSPNWYPACFTELVINLFKRYDNLNIWVNRVVPYRQDGRIQTEAESNNLAVLFKKRIKEEFGIYFTEVDGDELAVSQILAILAKEEESCSKI